MGLSLLAFPIGTSSVIKAGPESFVPSGEFSVLSFFYTLVPCKSASSLLMPIRDLRISC